MNPEKIILLIDTTYFGRKYGYMIFRAWFPELQKGKNLLWYKVDYETNNKYREGVKILIDKGWNICGIVCDGRQGLLGGFGDIPVQMCIYHMKQIITRYLTKKPLLKQNKYLKNISMYIGEYPEDDIKLALEVWYQDNEKRLKEKNNKGNYIHVRTRKAYFSIKKKLQWCYTYENYKELGIPKTNNSLESINSHLKTKLGIHRGLNENRKDKFISYYLWIS